MARDFTSASEQLLQNNSAVLTVVPITLVCWFNAHDITNDNRLIKLQDTADGYYFTLRLDGNANDTVVAQAFASGGTNQAASTATYTADTWHHAAAVFVGNAERHAYLDGGNKGSETTSQTPSSIDATYIGGARNDNGFCDASIAEAAIWNTDLTEAEIAVLATGVSPLAVRPQSLVAYWPLVGNLSPELDFVGGYDMALTNGPTKADHPPVQKVWPVQPYNFGYISHHARLAWRNQHQILRFDADTREHTIFRARLPQQYAGNGIELNLHYSMATATAGNVKWGAAFERIADQGLDIDGDDFAPFNYRDIEVPAVSGNVGIAKIRFIHGEDMDSVVAGDLFRVKIIRDAEADVATGDAELHTIEVREL